MKNQIEKVLPRSAWDNVVIHENNEPLVEVKQTQKLKIGLIKKSYQPSFFVRKTIAEKLVRVSENLPQSINLVLIEGYRSLESQEYEWNLIFKEIKNKNPDISDDEIEKQVRLIVAKPSPLANHHCGGAVDIALVDDNGILIDMGTSYISQASFDEKQRFQMLSSEITEEQKANRKILRDAMETEDFVWYPGEWWHYCWGDRMWAVYSNQTKCFYGPVYLS